MTQETTTDGTTPQNAVAEVESPVSETKSDVSNLSGQQAKLWERAVRRIVARPNRKKPDPWALTTLRDKLTIAKEFSHQAVARIALVDVLTVKQKVDASIALAEELISPDTLNPELRLKGVAILTGAAKVSGDLAELTLRIAEKAALKTESANGNRPKNRPPATGIEVTIGEGQEKVTARAVATNGETPP